jgi:hypothetical protein
MTANWAESQRQKEVEEESDTSGLTIAEEAVSFHVCLFLEPESSLISLISKVRSSRMK